MLENNTLNLEKNKKKIEYSLYEFLNLIALFLLAFVLVYKTPSVIRDFGFLIILFFAYRSQKEHFWLAFVFLLINSPLGLFSANYIEAQYRLPIYNLVPKISFTFFDLFSFLILYKVFTRGKNIVRDITVIKPFFIFLIYVIIISVPISFFFTNDYLIIIKNFRAFFYYSFIFIFIAYLNNSEKIYRFGLLLLPFVFLELSNQIYALMNGGEQLVQLLGIKENPLISITQIEQGERFIMGEVLVLFFSLFISFAYQTLKKDNWVLPIISWSVIFSFILAGARAWITMGLTVFVIYLLKSGKFVRSISKYLFILASLIIILSLSGLINIPVLNDTVFYRYFSMFSALRTGNLENYSTFGDRITTGLPNVIKGISQDPVLGLGFSDESQKYYNNDFGFLNTIILYGIVGLAIFLSAYLIILFRLFDLSKTSKTHKHFYVSLLAMFTAMLIGYLFTWDFFAIYPEKVMFVSLLLAIIEIIYKEEKMIKKNFMEDH